MLEKPGRILTFTGDGGDARAFGVLSNVDDRGEGGLLGMALHPAYGSQNNRVVLVSYTTEVDGDFVSRVSQFSTNDTGTELDFSTERVFLAVTQDRTNHNGGWMGFGPDNYLYVALGGGGGADDPFGNGQRPDTLMAKTLRLEVDQADPVRDRLYSIPEDTPYRTSPVIDEAFAWGLRNPWRASFDTATGSLWVADVGQNRREEVNIVRAGANLGWSIREGNRCFAESPCASSGLTAPVHDYPRGDGRSVTGGYVYRGSAIPGLVGSYVFADYLGTNIWALTEQSDGSWARETLVARQDNGISSFGRDNDGELYVVNLNLGRVLKLVPADQAPEANDFPTLLSQTGCMNPDKPSEPGPMLVPYEPAAQLWSDRAEKQRWLALPDGETIEVTPDGDFTFPVGTVLVEQFERDGRLLETRFYMRHVDGDWAGYTYRWNDAQTEARLLADAALVTTPTQSWRIPSRPQCQQCHTAAAGHSLGLEIAQLNHDFSYPLPEGSSGPKRRANQLRTFAHIGFVTDLPPESERDALPGDTSDAPVSERARSYLHANCSGCHRPGGGARGDLDLRYQTSLAESGLCAEPQLGDFSIPEARILAAGAPERSIFLIRMNRVGEGRMPQLGTVEVDDHATNMINSWVEGLRSCD